MVAQYLTIFLFFIWTVSMGRKKKTPKFPPLSLETSKSNIKLQPTISQSFNRVGEEIEAMDDSDDDVCSPFAISRK